MDHSSGLIAAAVALSMLTASAATANERITYAYDARGRLIKVHHTVQSGSNPNNNNQACYKYDKADNRTNVTVTMGPSAPPACPT